MIHFYPRRGAGGFELIQRRSDDEWASIRVASIRLLRERGCVDAAARLEDLPFEVWDASNDFNDDFCVLYFATRPKDYAELEALARNHDVRTAFEQIVNAVEKAGIYVRYVAVSLDTRAGTPTVAEPTLVVTSDVVERALEDAKKLICTRSAASAVDRMHTALHGHLWDLCARSGLVAGDSASLTELFSALLKRHPAFTVAAPRQADIVRIVRSMSAIVDAVNTLRNQASNAHPNESILAEPEAMLVLNSVRTLLHYVDAKVRDASADSSF